MARIFSLEAIPFLVSLFLEIISPWTGKWAKRNVERFLREEKAPESVIDLFDDSLDFSYDMLQVISAFLLTFAGGVALPFLKARSDVGLVFTVVMFLLFVVVMTYFGITNPNRHSKRKIGVYGVLWGWVPVTGFVLNVVLIGFFLATDIL